MNCIVQCSYFTDIYIVQGLNIINKIIKINKCDIYYWKVHSLYTALVETGIVIGGIIAGLIIVMVIIIVLCIRRR